VLKIVLFSTKCSSLVCKINIMVDLVKDLFQTNHRQVGFNEFVQTAFYSMLRDRP